MCPVSENGATHTDKLNVICLHDQNLSFSVRRVKHSGSGSKTSIHFLHGETDF